MALFSGVALFVSALLGYSRGVDGAVTLFALSVGGASTGALEYMSRKRRHTGMPIFLLILNFALVSVGMWLLTGLIPR